MLRKPQRLTSLVEPSRHDFNMLNNSVYSSENTQIQALDPVSRKALDGKLEELVVLAHKQYDAGAYDEAQSICEAIYNVDALRTDSLLLLGAVHFQLRNFSECIFYNQQCIRIDPRFAEAYSNLGNALKELGDVDGAIQFYVKAIRLKPRFCDAYNNLASAHMQVGQPQEAVEAYQMALVLQPSLVDAHNNLGNLCKMQGMLEEAKRCFLEAIRIQPQFAVAWNNLAGVFKEEGRLDTAVAYYREAIRLRPSFADAYNNLGNALQEQGLVQEALQAYLHAIKLRPDFAIVYGNLAGWYQEQGQIQQAITSFKHSLQLEPRFPDAHNNLGNALREVGASEDAIEAYRQALRLKPDHPHAYNNLGNAMKEKGLIREAIHCYVTAIRLMPRFAIAHSNLGNILREQGKLDQSLAHYREAVAIQPTFTEGHCNMGSALRGLGRLSEAIDAYQTAIRINPSLAEAHYSLGTTYADAGRCGDAAGCFRRALDLKIYPQAFACLVHCNQLVCNWTECEKNILELTKTITAQIEDPGNTEPPVIEPFKAVSLGLPPSLLRGIATHLSRRVISNVNLLDTQAFRHHRSSASKGPCGDLINIGYISSDFCNHPIGHLVQGMFGMHDRPKFQVTCYSLGASDNSEWRHRIESTSDQFRDVSGMRHSDVARVIHKDNIDILIDLNGYSKGSRCEILALRPAPIQATWLGYPGTSGADYIQYLIGDHTVIPSADRGNYSESLVYMPHTYFVAYHRESSGRLSMTEEEEPATRSSLGLPQDKFVFCNFSQLYKVDRKTFDVWMSILRRVPNSVLWLLRFPPAAEANLIAEATSRDISASRLVFTDVAPKWHHIKRSALADLGLDTQGVSGQTATCDTLWGGTPVITCVGEGMASRVSASLLQSVGLAELVTDSPKGYEDLAVELATDTERLFEVRRKLESGKVTSPLFDTQRWVKSFEGAIESMVAAQKAGKPPSDVEAPDFGPTAAPTAADQSGS